MRTIIISIILVTISNCSSSYQLRHETIEQFNARYVRETGDSVNYLRDDCNMY